MSDRLIEEGEDLHGLTLISAQGHRRWKATRIISPHPRRYGYPRGDVVYNLDPQGGDTYGFGGVKALVRSENELLVWGWRVCT